MIVALLCLLCVRLATAAEPDVFARFWEVSGPIADGYAPPVQGSGWQVCGPGCWTRARPAAVRAIAAGEVVGTQPLRIHHQWYENHLLREIESTWVGLDAALAPGDAVARGQVLGATAALTLTLTGTEEDPSAFVAARPRAVVPQQQPVVALISHDAYELRVYRGGVETARYPVSFGQEAGAKERRGDNRTPKGMYYVTERSRGPFSGDVAAYYGGLWLRLNYPNPWDAARGVDAGLITAAQQAAIYRAWWARQTTLRDTRLGGGIGIHAWAYPWSLDGPRHLSWGCIVVQPDDADAVDAALPTGALIVLF